MAWIISSLIIGLVTAISLFILSKLPLGVEIDSFQKSIVSAIVFGILNAILAPILQVLAAPLRFLSFGLLSGLVTVVINIIIFGLAAWLVQGFRLRWGIWSAVLGGIVLGIINSILFKVLGSIFPGLIPTT
jgi:putative membrane protein